MSEKDKKVGSSADQPGQDQEKKIKLPPGFTPMASGPSDSPKPTPVPVPRPDSSAPSLKEAKKVIKSMKEAASEEGQDDQEKPAKPAQAEVKEHPARKPVVEPVRLDPAKVYPPESKKVSIPPKPSEPKKEEPPKPVPATIPDGKAEKPEAAKLDQLDDLEDLEIEDRKDSRPEPAPKKVVPDPKEVGALVATTAKSVDSEMEVLSPERRERQELSVPEERVSKWAFWKRPSKRDQQLAQISEGYLEMIDLVRAIRGQLESQNENNVILRESLVQLPKAVKGLENFSKSQETVSKALSEVHGQMQRFSERDERLADSMDGFNSTLKVMDDTSKATMKTFDRVQERMRDSDIRMENLFQNVQSTEEKVGETMVRLQRNMSIMQIVFLTCLLIVIGVLVFTVVSDRDEEVERRPSKEAVTKD